MKVWVVVDFNLKMFNDHVFSSKENVVAWWNKTHARDVGGKILELPPDPPEYPARLLLGYREDPFDVHGEAREIEVDACCIDKGEQ